MVQKKMAWVTQEEWDDLQKRLKILEDKFQITGQQLSDLTAKHNRLSEDYRVTELALRTLKEETRKEVKTWVSPIITPPRKKSYLDSLSLEAKIELIARGAALKLMGEQWEIFWNSIDTGDEKDKWVIK